jgi:hypothetical protein
MLLASSRRATLLFASRRSTATCATSILKASAQREFGSAAAYSWSSSRRHISPLVLGAMGAVGAWMALSSEYENYNNSNHNTMCAARIPTSGDVLSIGKITKEPATGISFGELCNGMKLAGVGVRIKYVFVKVYAVGAYFDPIAMMAVKKGSAADMQQALLDPTYPRTIRIVMNRGLSVDKFIAAIVEAVEPRLKGRDTETLEEFKGLFAPVDLVEG